MSDSLYKPKDMNLVRPKIKGMLHFSHSSLARDGTRIIENNVI